MEEFPTFCSTERCPVVSLQCTFSRGYCFLCFCDICRRHSSPRLACCWIDAFERAACIHKLAADVIFKFFHCIGRSNCSSRYSCKGILLRYHSIPYLSTCSRNSLFLRDSSRINSTRWGIVSRQFPKKEELDPKR